ncbi:uncharacterized protein LOC134276801 isoform X2 [Saccostrea cucullata]|uniref:uncharacterized protein LOC134276801 isoform X2 n=1 Tax=Saccostrea cuccullata TaxID=36930 RepID=UPI002ED48017
MDHIPRLSEVLYVGLCRKIGTPTVVAIRRDVRDAEDMIEKTGPTFVKNACKARKMLSGSYREGFRFDTSDLDYMVWYYNFQLINDISKLRAYNSSKYDILLMEDTDTPPGFVRLQLLTPIRSKVFGESVIPFNGRNYVSSFLWRQVWFKDHSQRYQNATHHGPCFSSIIGSVSLDRAVCLTSRYWPCSTKQHWMERCVRHMWPPASMLRDILNNDCHCMAIGSKCTTSENELEWRLSFSLAEQKLVYTMNHTQFVCYGLLKIFLTEVINKNVEEPLLCSYFMKTTMFWLIQIGHMRTGVVTIY